MEKWLCGGIAVLAGLLLACSGAFLAGKVKRYMRGTYTPGWASEDFDPCDELFYLAGGKKRARFVGDIERTAFFLAAIMFGKQAGLFSAAIGWAALKLAANWGARLKGSDRDELAICAMSALMATLASVGMALAGGLVAGYGVRALWATLFA